MASEADLRRVTGAARIPVKALRYLPQLSVPAETGSGTELLYAFAPAAPLRKAALKVQVTTEMEKCHLPAGFTLSEDHTDKVMSHCVSQSSLSHGCQSALGKELLCAHL